ncbi:MAG: hypothetical protein HY769_10490 [Candidatus Stahlbacteria bacterium]|nr:hypothetical protein [Candidatus Stahlbacteria bacterium]
MLEQEKIGGKEESFWDGLLRVGAIIGGAWIGIELVKLCSRRVYRCPNPDCRGSLNYHQSPCPHCKAIIEWEF